MNPTQPISTTQTTARYNYGGHQTAPRSTVSWGAIFAGMSAALAMQVLFMMLGAGLGFAMYSPVSAENPVASLSIGALLIQTICAILSLCLGGWVAGRFSSVANRATGWLHGFSVWCAATVGGVIMVALGAGLMLSGLSSIVGGGLSAVGQPVSAVAGGAVDLAGDALKQSQATISSFVDEAMSNLPDDAADVESIRAKREVGFAVARLFNPVQNGNTADNRAEAVTALVDHTGLSQAEADRAITEWTSTFERLQDDLTAMKDAAQAQALEAADAASSTLAIASLLAFFGFLLGALAATWGGNMGAKCATRCEESYDHPASA